MCGFFFHSSERQISHRTIAKIKSAGKRIASRGPDSEGFLKGKNYAGVNYRLAFVGSGTNQLPHADKEYELFFEGEIYNYQALAKNLGMEVDQNTSDFEIFGEYFKRFRTTRGVEGMFCFIFIVGNEIYFGRDAYGLKSLYYSCEHGLTISSQCKPLLSYSPREMDIEGTSNFLAKGFSDTKQTVFKNIFQVLPGETYKAQIGKCPEAFDKYSLDQLGLDLNFVSTGRFAEDFLLRVNEVVGNQTEVGIFLSSGMDSRIVFECLLELGKNVTVFSFGDPNSIEKFSRDVNEAQRLAKKFGCRFESVSLLHCDVNDKLQEYFSKLDYPSYSSSGFLLYLLYERAASLGLRVVITGDGADEYFNGYSRYELIRKLVMLRQFVPRFVLKLINSKISRRAALSDKNLLSSFLPKTTIVGMKNDREKTTVGLDCIEPGDTYSKNRVEATVRAMEFDRSSWLANMSNPLSNSLAGLFGIEVRSPFQYAGFVNYHSNARKMISKAKFFHYSFPDIDFLTKSKIGLFGPLSDLVRTSDVFHPISEQQCHTPLTSYSTAYNEFLHQHRTKERYCLHEIWTLKTLFECFDKG